MRARIAGLCLVAAMGLAAPAARAGEPIMPLSEVRAGMRCTALSVIRGTRITAFDAEVIDVVAGSRGIANARILIRVSGPAVDVTGIGSGFSGSPIYCPDAQGLRRNAGAIAEGTSDFGNKVVLATPIEQILREPADPPSGVRARRAAKGHPLGRPLLAPLTVHGLSPRLMRRLVAAGRRAGRVVLQAPAGPLSFFLPQPLIPGASVSAGLASGDLGIGSIGTVAYADGDTVWAFGHPLEGVGRRALLLQDAYVYTVVNNPTGADQLSSYKLASPGHDLGTLTNDGLSAAVGRVGAVADRIPLRVTAEDQQTRRRSVLNVVVPDETAVDLPTGSSALSLVGALALGQASAEALGGAPTRMTESMCVRISVRERRRPLRFCNRYVVGGTESGAGPAQGEPADPTAGLAQDFTEAVSLLENATFARLRVAAVDVSIKLRRGQRQAFIVGATAPSRVRPGQRVRIRLRTRRVRGPRRTFSFPLRIPSGLRPGTTALQLTGTAGDSPAAGAGVLTILLSGGGEDDPDNTGGDPGPRSLDELADQVSGIARYDGVKASFAAPGRGRRRSGEDQRLVFRDPNFRISGNTVVALNVVAAPARRRR